MSNLEYQVTFLGGGSFGTSLACLLSKKGLKVVIWDKSESTVKAILAGENAKYLPGLKIPKDIYATTSMEEALKHSSFVICAVPSHAVRPVIQNAKAYIKEKQIIVSIAKGIEESTGKRISEVLEEELPQNKVVILSGPSHAEEVAKELPTTVVVSSNHMDATLEVQDLFMTERFRVYSNSDLIGVEIGGAVKNIIALAAGVSDGIGCGDNTKAALMTRGMHEIIKIGTALNGEKETFYGLTGMGDLIVTCTSMHSRNRRAGILIGQGHKPSKVTEEVGMVVEGIKATKAFHELSKKLNIEMPITEALYKVLFEDRDPKKALQELMTRDKKSESY